MGSTMQSNEYRDLRNFIYFYFLKFYNKDNILLLADTYLSNVNKIWKI